MATPIWWIALVVLVSNDFLFKYLPNFPEALSGKLSDFAGLVVFPVLLARTRNRGGRVAIFVAVGVLFSAMKLFSPVAAVVEHATALIGVPWSIELDPTDLVAIAVLPFAYLLLDRETATKPSRLALVLGGVACLASGGEQRWTTRAFVVNRTSEPMMMRLRFPRGTLDCALVQGRAARALAPEAFGGAQRFVVDSHTTLALDETAHASGQDSAFRGDCSAAILEVDGRPDTLVFWNAQRTLTVPVVFEPGETPDGIPADQMLEVYDRDGEITLERGGAFEISPVLTAITEDACESSLTPSERFEWSDPNLGSISTTLRDVVVQGDGCTDYTLDFSEHFTLCAPPEELPFAPGDRVAITAEAHSVEISRSSTVSSNVTVLVYSGPAATIPHVSSMLVELGCSAGDGGYRLACGSYAVPSGLELANGLRLIPGIGVDLPGKHTRYVLGRAEQLAVGAAACELGRDAAGAFVDLMIITEEEDAR